MKIAKEFVLFPAIIFILGVAVLFWLALQLLSGALSIKTVRIDPKDLEHKRL